MWSPGEEVAKLAYFGLYALQHRGQESAGIAVSDGDRIVVYKDMGLVAQVFDEAALSTLRGYIAVGHCRYSTSGASTWENAQPTFRSTPVASLALGHNGNLINTLELAATSRRVPWRPCRWCAGPFRWSSWLSTPCTRPVTRRASAPWCWASWPMAG